MRPGQPVRDYDEAPYPGRRPVGSWVIDPDQRLFPVHPDATAASGWSVSGGHGSRRWCLDEWLVEHGGAAMSQRFPVLSYGSNANPQKVVRNGVSLPAVSLACVVEDLAAVWCRDTRGVERMPATLVAWPGNREHHALSYVGQQDLIPLDLVEGRAAGWYRLVRLTAGRVVREDARVPERVLSYVGSRADRRPLLDADRRPVRLSELGHAQALRAVHRQGYTTGSEPDLGPVITPTGTISGLPSGPDAEPGP
ncbi:MAG: hypothetical protein L0H31_09870 [Nocardioidaceae bacterium]|nr:hypothetical protein [Nocardioidaceae bacterium]